MYSLYSLLIEFVLKSYLSSVHCARPQCYNLYAILSKQDLQDEGLTSKKPITIFINLSHDGLGIEKKNHMIQHLYTLASKNISIDSVVTRYFKS